MKVILKSSIELGNDIRLFRTRKHWSQRDLAIPLNVSAQAISNWERGTSYMSLDIIVQLCHLMGMSLDDFLLIDDHGSYSYASVFDRFRLRDFWIDLYDMQKHPETGQLTIDLRIQSDRYSHFIETIFSAVLLNEKEQEISVVIEGWVDDERGSYDKTISTEITRMYRIRYSPIHRPRLMLIQYNGFIKHIDLNPEYVEAIVRAEPPDALNESTPELEQQLIDFYMKSKQVDRLMHFMTHRATLV